MSASKPITVIATLQPVDDKGRRPVTVSGAPDGEMPTIRTGFYPDLHRLIDEVWVELLTRQPKTVKTGKPAAKKKRTNRSGSEAEAEPEPEAEETPETEPAETEATEQTEPAETTTPELPTIEGDDAQ